MDHFLITWGLWIRGWSRSNFKAASGPSSYLSKYCSGFSSSLFYDIIFNVISEFTGSFCSKMIISTQSAQNHTTSQSKSSSTVLIFNTYGSCHNQPVLLQHFKKFSFKKQLYKQSVPELACISLAPASPQLKCKN